MARKQPATTGIRTCLNHRDPVNWKKVAAQNPRWVFIVCQKCNGHIAYEPIDGGRASKLLESAQGKQPSEQPSEQPKPTPRIKAQPSQEPATAGESPISTRRTQISLFG